AAMSRMRARQATPRSIASGVSSFMSPPPEPRRTTSLARVSVSNPPPGAGRATTMWKLFVPMSKAARFMASPGSARRQVVGLGDATAEAVDHAEAEVGDLLEGAALQVVVEPGVADDDRRLHR